jgi:hypothetical protein
MKHKFRCRRQITAVPAIISISSHQIQMRLCYIATQAGEQSLYSRTPILNTLKKCATIDITNDNINRAGDS